MSELLYLVIALLSAPCAPGQVASIDGIHISESDVITFKTMEGITGLTHSSPTAFLASLERRAMVAIAERSGIAVGESELTAAFETAKNRAVKPALLSKLFRVVGADFYRRWTVAPNYAERRLTEHFDGTVTTEQRKLAERVLRVLLTGKRSAEALAKASQGQVHYARFRVTPRNVLLHFTAPVREGYLERKERFERGQEADPPLTPQPPVEHVEGLGTGHRGYVEKLAKILRELDDGAWSPNLIRDERQWLLVRRLSRNSGVYEAEGIRVPIPEFHDWVVTRYRDLEITICADDLFAQAAAFAPSNAFVELLQ